LEFPDYTDDEMVEIFTLMTEKGGYSLAPDVVPAVRDLLRGTARGESFGNGRFIRNVFDRAVALQGHRITASDEPSDVRLLVAKDLPPAQSDEPDDLSRLYL
jgi:hypothetical protein